MTIVSLTQKKGGKYNEVLQLKTATRRPDVWVVYSCRPASGLLFLLIPFFIPGDCPMGRKLTLNLGHDSDVEEPDSGYDGWKLWSFSRKHTNFKHPDEFTNIGYIRKFQVGLAFRLSYYEHSGCAWSIRGNSHPMHRCPWDSVDFAGVLVWTGKPGDIGAKTYDDRLKDASQFIETYNHWVNGNCYWYSLEEEDYHGRDITSMNHCGCGGYIGWDDIKTAIRDEKVFQPGDQIIVRGEAKEMAQYLDLPDGAEIVEEFEDVETSVETGDYVI